MCNQNACIYINYYNYSRCYYLRTSLRKYLQNYQMAIPEERNTERTTISFSFIFFFFFFWKAAGSSQEGCRTKVSRRLKLMANPQSSTSLVSTLALCQSPQYASEAPSLGVATPIALIHGCYVDFLQTRLCSEIHFHSLL